MEIEKQNNESQDNENLRRQKLRKAVLISALSPITTIMTAGLGGAITGILGSIDYEVNTGTNLGFGRKLGYTVASTIGLGVINPYTYDLVNKK